MRVLYVIDVHICEPTTHTNLPIPIPTPMMAHIYV